MIPLPRFSDPRLSLWQSSVASVIAREVQGGVDAVRSNPYMIAASHAAASFQGLDPGEMTPPVAAAVATAGVSLRASAPLPTSPPPVISTAPRSS